MYRRISLTVASKVHVVPDGVFAPSTLVNGTMFAPSVEIANDYRSPMTVRARFVVHDSGGDIVGEGASSIVRIPADTQKVLQSRPFNVDAVLGWSTHTPVLYNLVVIVESSNTSAPAGQLSEEDMVTTRIGFRETRWSADRGLFVNGKTCASSWVFTS